MERSSFSSEFHNCRLLSHLPEQTRTQEVNQDKEGRREHHNDILQLPHGTDSQDRFARMIVSFGVTEARNHRLRGVTLPMFLGLLKYYRLSYIDLIQQAGFEGDYKEECVLFIERIFDLIELGIITEWADFSRSKLLGGLQKANRLLALEKHKYLNIFEKIREPVIVLDDKNRIKEMNQSAAKYSKQRRIHHQGREGGGWWRNNRIHPIADAEELRLHAAPQRAARSTGVRKGAGGHTHGAC